MEANSLAIRGSQPRLALGFAGEGADISLSYYQSTNEARQTESEVRSSGVRCKAVKADLRRLDALREAAQTIEESLGGIDILINNAGVFEKTGGQVSGAGGDAEVLGLHANTLRYRMKKLGITVSRKTGTVHTEN